MIKAKEYFAYSLLVQLEVVWSTLPHVSSPEVGV
jgi:hypothetical protein